MLFADKCLYLEAKIIQKPNDSENSLDLGLPIKFYYILNLCLKVSAMRQILWT